MRRRFATLAATAAVALVLSASPALASPGTVASYPAAGEVITCGVHTYTFTSGEYVVVARDPSVAAHVTVSHVWATDGDASFRVVGAETYSDSAGRLTVKLMFVGSSGGIADSLNIVLRYDRDGNMHVGIDSGTCGF
jgi:hypothetical protein